MSQVVRLPDELLAQMAGAPWVTALEPLTPTLPYDLAVTAGGIPTAELAKITVPVLTSAARTARADSSVQSPNRPPPRQARSSRCLTDTTTTRHPR